VLAARADGVTRLTEEVSVRPITSRAYLQHAHDFTTPLDLEDPSGTVAELPEPQAHRGGDREHVVGLPPNERLLPKTHARHRADRGYGPRPVAYRGLGPRPVGLSNDSEEVVRPRRVRQVHAQAGRGSFEREVRVPNPLSQRGQNRCRGKLDELRIRMMA
jgi:hypothetical protein